MAIAPCYQILETKTEDPEVLSSLGVLSTFYAANSASDRRRLRSTIERKGLDVTSELLEGAESILGCLDSVEADLRGLSRSCEGIREALASHKASAGGFLALADRFSEDLKVNARKKEVVGSFLKKYQLSPKEVGVVKRDEICGEKSQVGLYVDDNQTQYVLEICLHGLDFC